MPFSGPSSYLSTIDEFLGHWTDVDAALAAGGENPLVLTGGYDQADLQTDRTDLAAFMTDLEGFINVHEGHRTSRFNQQPLIKERKRQLGSVIRGTFSDSVYVGQIPPLVQDNASPGKWTISCDDFAHLWTTFNAAPPAGFVPPLLLSGGYTLAMFNTDIAALKTTYTAYVTSSQDVDRALKDRDDLYLKIRDRLVNYRIAVEGRFPAGHPLILSIPRLVPLPGHTPDPVVLSGVWNPGTEMADLSWTASADADLAGYSVRRSGSDPYNSNTEQVVQSVGPGVLALSTNEGLVLDGAVMRFKVYVILDTGNEAGSNAVEINKP